MMIAQTNQRQRKAWQDTQPREIEPGDLIRHYPKGLDYQGRYPEAAHAASEYADDEPSKKFSVSGVVAWTFGTAIGVICIAAGWHFIAAFIASLRT